ncbi:hypothetical protein ACFV0G_39670, partial [Kitasatospora sp. NPDC059571]
MRPDRRAAAADPAPAVTDLHAGLPELSPRLVAAAEEGRWLDAFLYGAGMLQIAEDRLQGTARPAARPRDPPGGGPPGPAPPAAVRTPRAPSEWPRRAGRSPRPRRV